MQRAVLRLNRYSHSHKLDPSLDQDKMIKKAVLFLTDNAEESEVVITVDTLRRAGVECVIAGVNGCEPVTCVEKTRIVPDVEIDRCQNEVFDVVIIPGGPGSESLSNNSLVQSIVQKHVQQNKIIGAICSGTKVCNSLKVCYGCQITTYPKYKDVFTSHYKLSNERVVCDNNLITSQGPGTAFEFGLTIVKVLFGVEKARELTELLRVNNFNC